MALLLQRWGITRAHPLEGGLARWKALGFPVRELSVPEIPILENLDVSRR